MISTIITWFTICAVAGIGAVLWEHYAPASPAARGAMAFTVLAGVLACAAAIAGVLVGFVTSPHRWGVAIALFVFVSILLATIVKIHRYMLNPKETK